VITGFNTDVTYDGVTYHVQTEDKGVESAFILSLVYDRGTILAAKRSPYDDLISAGFDVKVLEERLQRQHKLICAAIKAGRIEDLKRLSASTTRVAPSSKRVGEVPARIPMPEEAPVWDLPPLEELEKAAGTEPEEAFAPPVVVEARDVLVVEPPAPAGIAADKKLKLKIVGQERFLKGERKNLNVLVCRGAEESSVGGANVMIKILGSDFRPLIYHAKADSNGIAAVMVKIPNFRSGRAAIMIRAIIEGEEAELRRPIAHQ